MPTDYSNGKIYTIRCRSDPDHIYVGSTVQPLYKRWGGHKCDSKRHPEKGKLYPTIGNNWEDWYIELYEEYPCENKEQLCKREGQIIREIGKLNKNIEGRTDKEYYQDNIGKIKEYKKKYTEENADKIKEREREYRQLNTDKIKDRNKEYCQQNADQIKEKKKEYRQLNADQIKEYRQINTDTMKAYQKEYRKLHADQNKEYQKEYTQKNAEKLKEYKKAYYQRKKLAKIYNISGE